MYKRLESHTKIIETIAKYYGTPISITNLVLKIRQHYGSAYYAYINKVVHTLVKEGILNISKIGRSLIVTLNFEKPSLSDILTEIEIEKKYQIFSRHSRIERILSELSSVCKDLLNIHSTSIINAEKNIKLNRIELLILFKSANTFEEQKPIRNTAYITSLQDITSEKEELVKALQSIGNKNNIRVDYLVLSESEFFSLLSSDELNQVKEMMTNKITTFNPQLFWMQIIDMRKRGINDAGVKTINSDFIETNPISITERDMIFNLSRFGYTQFGEKVTEGRLTSIEYIITSILMRGEARRLEAIPIIMQKNISRISAELLAFLTKKYNVSDKLSDVLSTAAYKDNHPTMYKVDEK